MRGVVAKAIRKQVKLRTGMVVTAAPEYYITQTKKRLMYVDDGKGGLEAKPVDRIVIVNKTKNQYRKIKKLMKKQRQYGLNLAA